MDRIRRIGSIDFWRGIVLVAIMADHIPGNLLEFLTPRNFGISDSAEAFVFLSGISVGLAYFAKAERQGMAAIVRSALMRAGLIYGVHIALTSGGIIIFSLGYWLWGLPDLMQMHGRDVLLFQPWQGMAGILLLSHQLGYFNILPLYIALMLWAPVAIGLARYSKMLTLAVSLCLYAITRHFGLGLPAWPQPGTWFFNPLAWQLVFTLGIVSAIEWRDKPLPRAPMLRAGGWLIVLTGGLIATNALGLMPELRATVYADLDIGKQNLGLMRLGYFLALAYSLATTPQLMLLAGQKIGTMLQQLGRQSLKAFVIGSLLTAAGQVLMLELGTYFQPEALQAIAAAYTVCAVIFLFRLVGFLDAGLQGLPDAIQGFVTRMTGPIKKPVR